MALEEEYHNLPAVIDLAAVRRDYAWLLQGYEKLADALVALKVRPPADFQARVVRAADRWRALDPGPDLACWTAGRIFQVLGDREVSWDYLTTPIGLRPNESGSWLALADRLQRQGELELADRSFAAAFAAEPTNAQILWDRAQNLRQAGHTVAAQRLFRQVAEGPWQPRFQDLQTQAKWQLRGR